MRVDRTNFVFFLVYFLGFLGYLEQARTVQVHAAVDTVSRKGRALGALMVPVGVTLGALAVMACLLGYLGR